MSEDKEFHSYMRDIYREPELQELELGVIKIQVGKVYKFLVGRSAIYGKVEKITPTRLSGTDIYGNKFMIVINKINMVAELSPDNWFRKALKIQEKTQEKAEETTTQETSEVNPLEQSNENQPEAPKKKKKK